MGTVDFDWLVTSSFSELLERFSVQCSCCGKDCLCCIAVFLNQSNSVKMEATNQLSESEEENIIDPITVAVNCGASLSALQGASIARNGKLPAKKGNNKQRGSSKTTNVSAWERLKE